MTTEILIFKKSMLLSYDFVDLYQLMYSTLKKSQLHLGTSSLKQACNVDGAQDHHFQ